jgi:uncharacterized membrane protein YdjX (TVP38/TMEM64 family)
MIVFFVCDLHQYMTLAYIKDTRAIFHTLYQQHTFSVLAVFFLIYVAVTALSLPGAAAMTLAAGAVFGFWVGLILVSFASTLGATLACALARYLFRDWAESRLGTWLGKINAGVQREGGLYLFTLRLIPVVPFFIINLGMALTSLPLVTFYWVSQVGMLAGTAVYINAGKQLAEIRSLGEILSFDLILSFVILGLFPLGAKKAVNFFRAKTGRQKITRS